MSDQIAEPQTDNSALRRILSRVEDVANYLLGNPSYTVNNGGAATHTATTGAPYIRAEDDTIQKTVVTNLGVYLLVVKESGVTVAVINQYETYVSDLSGYKEYTIVPLNSGETVTFAIASYKKA